ncbi:MAG TPA: HAMP domain-containing protein, partial [Egibacteraceae bacterium]|nr:HAMP domain-containing protein [Egibacteraceae bacterium]
MGLRARLALFFVIITVLPLTATVVALESQIDRQLRLRAEGELSSARASASALIEVTRRRAGDLANDLALRGAGQVLAGVDPAAAQAWLAEQSPDQMLQRADLVLLVAAEGGLLAGVEAPSQFAPGVQKPGLTALASSAVTERGLPGVLLTVRRIPGLSPQPLGAVVTGVWTDRDLLDQLPAADGAAFVAEGQVLASLAGAPGAVPADQVPPPGEVAETTIDGKPVLVTAALRTPEGAQAGSALLLWAPLGSPGSGLGLTVALLAATVLVVGAIGWFLAGTVVAPVRRAADVARAVAGGDLSRSLQPTGGREL